MPGAHARRAPSHVGGAQSRWYHLTFSLLVYEWQRVRARSDEDTELYAAVYFDASKYLLSKRHEGDSGADPLKLR